MSESEKAFVFDIQRSALHDGPGIRTTIFLKGCPLDCLWCHNPEATSPKPQLFFHFDKCKQCGDCAIVCPENVHQLTDGIHTIDYEKCKLCGKCVDACTNNALKIIGKEMTVEEVMKEVRADTDFYKNSGGGITISGGEPLLQFAFAKSLLKQCKKEGIHTCVETSGFVSTYKFKEILPLIDILLFDYKITDTAEHVKYTGVSNRAIHENLKTAYNYGTPIILRCPIIPDVNDHDVHFDAIAKLSAKYPNLKGIEILPYHDMGNSKRTSVGRIKTLIELKTVLPEISNRWLEQLRVLGCYNAKIG